jgi:hypothetical protein
MWFLFSFPPYQMVCSDKSRFSCENLCGNPLPCGNHYCTKTCHPLENRSSTNQSLRSEACEDCSLSCQKVLHLSEFLVFYSLCCTSFFLILGLQCVFYVSLLGFNWINESELIVCLMMCKLHWSGKKAQVSTSLSSAMPSWRLPPMQGASQTVMSLWCNGPCFWVYLLQQPFCKGSRDCPVMRWTMS